MSQKLSNFDRPIADNIQSQKSGESLKANALREISELLQVVANLIRVQEDAASKIGMAYTPEYDTTVLELLDKCREISKEADMNIEIDISQYIEQPEDEDERDWDSSGCSEEWQSSGC